MPRDFFPRRDADAVSFTSNFSARLNADPELYRVTPQRAAEYATMQQAFAQAYRATMEPSTATVLATEAKKTARKTVESATREIGRVIRSRMGMATAPIIEIGLKVRSHPTRIGKPKSAPSLHVRNVAGRTVTIDLRDVDGDKRRKPRHVTFAGIFIHVGAEPPAPGEHWQSMGISTRTRVPITLPPATPPGAKVWVTAHWGTARGQVSASATPVCAYVGYAVALSVFRAA